MSFVYALGRAAFGAFFLYNGINHLKNTDALAGYAAAKQVPNPRESVQLTGALLVASGASLLFGLKPRLGALGVATFLLAASPSFHDFWNQQDAMQKQNETIHFSKNMALLGAAIAIMGVPCSSCRRD